MSSEHERCCPCPECGAELKHEIDHCGDQEDFHPEIRCAVHPAPQRIQGAHHAQVQRRAGHAFTAFTAKRVAVGEVVARILEGAAAARPLQFREMCIQVPAQRFCFVALADAVELFALFLRKLSDEVPPGL